MGFRDLRDYLDDADRRGILKVVTGADWNLEIGAIATMFQGTPEDPILVFDEIPGYPKGYRVLANHLDTVGKQATVLGAEIRDSDLETLRSIKDARRRIKPVPPVRVSDGPILENCLTGTDVDVLRFPVPHWRMHDGGRYLGTGTVVINRDPDEGWVNAGTYRQMVHDPRTVGFFVEPNHHGRIIARKFWERGESCPVVACYGQEQALLQASTASSPWGVSELDMAGGIRGEPLPVIEGPITGLPIPANAEIAIEGEVPPPEVDALAEGPFREWPGYYSQEPFPQPVIRIKAIYHRNDPILTGPPNCARFLNPYGSTPAAISVWEALERTALPGLRGVWAHANGLMIVVSLRQAFAGHAKMALLTAMTATASPSAYRYYVAVDEDIDPSDLQAVVWAMTTRCLPEDQIDIIPATLSAGIDPIISPAKRAVGDLTTGRVLVNACKPWTWIESFGESQLFPDGFEADLRRRRQDLFA
jgi:UbiD family decarboxylase